MAIVEASVGGAPAVWRPDGHSTDASAVALELAECGGDVVIDLTGYLPADTSDLGALVSGVRHFSNDGGHVVFVCPEQSTRRLLETTGIERIAPVFRDLSTAQSRLGS